MAAANLHWPAQHARLHESFHSHANEERLQVGCRPAGQRLPTTAVLGPQGGQEAHEIDLACRWWSQVDCRETKPLDIHKQADQNSPGAPSGSL